MQAQSILGPSPDLIQITDLIQIAKSIEGKCRDVNDLLDINF